MVVSHMVLKNFVLLFFFVFFVFSWSFFFFFVFFFLGGGGFSVFFCFFWFSWFFWLFGFICFFWFSGFDTLVEDALVDTNSPCFWQPPRAFSVIFGNVPKQSEISKIFRKQNLSESSEGPHSEPTQFLLWTTHEHF